jgi:hypothetical protein
MPVWARALALCLMAAYVLSRSVPAALLFLFPKLLRQRWEPDAPEAEDPEPVRKLTPQLTALGFRRLGVRDEIWPLGAATRSFDWSHPTERIYASVYLVDRKRTRLYFFTPYDGGAAVLTADHQRPGAVEDGYYLAGGLKNVSPEQLLAAHRRQMVAMEETGRERVGQGSPDDRIATARGWMLGAGKREMRARHVVMVLLAGLSLFALVSTLSTLPALLLGKAPVLK